MSTHAISALWRRKTTEESRKVSQLARHLTVLQLVPLGVGGTIGAGVYVLVGTVAREQVGPALPFSFLIAGTTSAFSALCYAELASRCPSAGSAYHYAYTCVGEFVAWIIGWALILENTVGGSAVARGIAPNLALLLGGTGSLPAWLSRREIFGIMLDPCAGVLVLFVTLLLCLGIRESAGVQGVMTVVNISVLLFVVVAGGFVGFKTGWQGYHGSGGYFPFGFDGVVGGAGTLFFAFIGFDTVASVAEEVKNPKRDLPLGISLTLTICSVLYMLVSLVVVGIVPFQQIDPDTPMSSVFADNGMHWAMYIVTVGAVAALCTTLLGSLLPQPRILMSMARDGLLPRFFSRINKASRVPVNGTLATGFIASGMAFTMDVDLLAGMVSVGTLLAFTIVGVSILMLRYAPPLTHEPATILPTSSLSSDLICDPQLVESTSTVVSTKESSVVACLPKWLENYDSSSEASCDSSYEDNGETEPFNYGYSSEKPLISSQQNDVYVELSEKAIKEKTRQWMAVFSIGVVTVGAVVLSLAFHFPSHEFVSCGQPRSKDLDQRGSLARTWHTYLFIVRYPQQFAEQEAWLWYKEPEWKSRLLWTVFVILFGSIAITLYLAIEFLKLSLDDPPHLVFLKGRHARKGC
ncbi:hypothetical protein R1flu_025328 [Riccia fluitans]|uniref:Cationic amino acid transporter n=1 Tax=Riccia fluitans TaxID=41844 RepID=A0ABD1Y0D8_9MARC